RVLGYFDPDHKKPLPPFPRRIAIVTSASGAAVHDVISTCAHRCAAVDLCIVDVRVQGTGAAEEVASAIRRLDAARDRLGLDAILVTRGGGSMEDLWAFNERVVADAVFRCTLPVVAAIGHESDTTIIELVADLRAATPTQAAMRLVPDAAELATQVEHFRSRLDLGLRRRVERARERVDRIARHGLFRDPGSRVVDAAARLERHRRMLRHIVVGRLAGERARLERLAGRMGAWRPQDVAVRRRAEVDAAAERLGRALVMHVRRLRERVTTDERQLQALNPQRVLSRGFSYTQRRDDGRLVRSVRDVGGGDVIVTRLHDGSVDSIVGGSEARRRPSRTPAPGDDQLDLFAGSE
ncbi:MAG: exodeoxyribonuclease VII large subunit, partial [Phycisphaerales bacterium]|nr:exodeoxyribonuclease VII large subunit [Phycisphaerales bacterium]